MQTKKRTVFWQLFLSSLILLATISSVVLASFQASRTNTSTLSFHENITLNITGVTHTGNNYYWNYKTSTSASTYTNGVASITGVVDYLELAPITVSASSGATCYVRVFACIGTNQNIVPLGDFATPSGTNHASVVAAGSYVSNETNFAFSPAPSQTKKFVSQCTIDANNKEFTMINVYIPYNAKGATNYANADIVNKKFYLYLSISASTDNSSWSTFVLTPPAVT